jgi:glutamine amidotransferase
LLLLGVNEAITNDKETLAGSTHLILPGVSSFGDGMKGLTERGLVGFLKTELSGQIFFGISLGMQLLTTKEFEYGEHEGLGIMPSEVVKINTKERLPHIGWNHHQLQSLIEVMKIVCTNATLPARSWNVIRRCNSMMGRVLR